MMIASSAASTQSAMRAARRARAQSPCRRDDRQRRGVGCQPGAHAQRHEQARRRERERHVRAEHAQPADGRRGEAPAEQPRAKLRARQDHDQRRQQKLRLDQQRFAPALQADRP